MLLYKIIRLLIVIISFETKNEISKNSCGKYCNSQTQ